jgi:hypothetical protein
MQALHAVMAEPPRGMTPARFATKEFNEIFPRLDPTGR